MPGRSRRTAWRVLALALLALAGAWAAPAGAQEPAAGLEVDAGGLSGLAPAACGRLTVYNPGPAEGSLSITFVPARGRPLPVPVTAQPGAPRCAPPTAPLGPGLTLTASTADGERVAPGSVTEVLVRADSTDPDLTASGSLRVVVGAGTPAPLSTSVPIAVGRAIPPAPALGAAALEVDCASNACRAPRAGVVSLGPRSAAPPSVAAASGWLGASGGRAQAVRVTLAPPAIDPDPHRSTDWLTHLVVHGEVEPGTYKGTVRFGAGANAPKLDVTLNVRWHAFWFFLIGVLGLAASFLLGPVAARLRRGVRLRGRLDAAVRLYGEGRTAMDAEGLAVAGAGGGVYLPRALAHPPALPPPGATVFDPEAEWSRRERAVASVEAAATRWLTVAPAALALQQAYVAGARELAAPDDLTPGAPLADTWLLLADLGSEPATAAAADALVARARAQATVLRAWTDAATRNHSEATRVYEAAASESVRTAAETRRLLSALHDVRRPPTKGLSEEHEFGTRGTPPGLVELMRLHLPRVDLTRAFLGASSWLTWLLASAAAILALYGATYDDTWGGWRDGVTVFLAGAAGAAVAAIWDNLPFLRKEPVEKAG